MTNSRPNTTDQDRTYSNNVIANTLISLRTHHGNGEYIIHGNNRITWDAFAARVFKLSRGLIKLGVKKDDKVALMFHNCPAFMEITFAIQIAGAIPTPMNYRYASPEIEFQANHSDAVIVMYDEIWADTLEPAVPQMKQVKHFICKGASSIEAAVDYESLIAANEDADPRVATAWDDTAVMIYTGGTTGRPKGVMLSYRSHLDMWATLTAQIAVRLLSQDMSAEKFAKLTENLPFSGKKVLRPIMQSKLFKKLIARPRAYAHICKIFYRRLSTPDAAQKKYKHAIKAMYASMPFFHISGFANMMLSILNGTLTYVTAESIGFDPAEILGLVEREKIATLTNVPTGWKKLVSYEDFDKYDVSSVRMAGSGGGPCSKDLKQKIMAKFPNAMVVDTFGQTEMTPVTSFKLDVDADGITDRSVGQSIVQTRIVDENGKDVTPGQTGEILYFSNTVMKGYYKDEEKTNEVLQDSWFKSGDLGYFDENGELRVVDRIKECINTGGEKVFPLEVEEVIQKHPHVEFACVIGVPDDEWGKKVCAVIQPKTGKAVQESEIVALCRTHLAGYKAPRSIVFVDEIPLSPAGKILRQQVKDNWGE